MGLFSSSSNDQEYSKDRVTELVKRATGNVKEKHLTRDRGLLSTYLFGGPLITYLQDGEQPEFIFRNTNKGYRITEVDGNESTPHHTGSEGKRYLLVTDQRLLYVAGRKPSDETIEHSYDEIVTIEVDSIKDLRFKTSSGKQFTFYPLTGLETKQAVHYVSKRVTGTVKHPHTSRPEATDPTEGRDSPTEVESSKADSSSQQEDQPRVITPTKDGGAEERVGENITDSIFCPFCGTRIENNWDFCLNCGEGIDEFNLAARPVESSDSEERSEVNRRTESNVLSEINRAEFKRKIQRLSPYEFENFVGEVWSELGWEAEVTKGAQDRGIDVVAQRDDKTELIQVKRYAIDNKVGSNEVRKYATLYQQESDADSIALVTASSFTRQAEELADDLDVRTIDSDDLYDYVKESGMNKDILTEDSISNTTQGTSSADEFVEIYGEFTELNKKLAKRVMMPASTAADYDGAEAAFARSGNREQLRFAIKMRNEWAEIINELENSITNMEGIPEKIPHAEFARLISEQIQTMYDLSEAYQRGLTYKDKLINSRFESAPIDPGGLRDVKVPNAEILLKPEADVEDLKRSQDVAMTIAAKETGKIGEFSDERQRIIANVAERIN